MDWLRRNWPDLLIGVALIAVIAGIIATLISGGSFFPVRDHAAEAPRATTPLTSSQDPGQSAGQPQSSNPAPAQSNQPAAPAAADEPPAVAVGEEGQEGAAQAGEGQAAEGADEPPADADRTPPPTQALPPDAGAGQPAADAPARSSVVSTPNRSGQAQQPRSSGGPLPPASASSEAPYRVSVGAFANAENAQRQLAAFQAAGYPVFIGTQGDLSIVLVGPYDTEEEARAVAARIAGSDLGVPDPTVYRLQADDSAPAASPSSDAQPAPAAGQSASSTPAASQASAAPAAGSSSRYLQVGAYASRDSSLPQRQRLEAMGFVVTDRVENGLVKLLVGPFDASELASAQTRLESAGIESFPR
jgi:cell division protein FtsN